MADLYCTQADLHAYGLPRGSFSNPGRLVHAVSLSLSSLELGDHEFADGDAVVLRAETGGSVPSPLVSGTTYYVIVLDSNRFRLATTVGGSPITLLSSGSGIIVGSDLPHDAAIQWASRLIDDMIPAALVPLSAPYSETIVMTAAELACAKLGFFSGVGGNSLSQVFDFCQKRLARWAKGVPIRGTNAPKPGHLAVSSTTLGVYAPPWQRYGGIR